VEPWLRGPVEGVPPLLQPAAHALLHVREDVTASLGGLTPEQLSARPGGAAPIAYHVRHIAGSLDRLLTYARGEGLSPAQLDALKAESGSSATTAGELTATLDAAIETALSQLRGTPAETLLDAREVGRARLPSTVLGLLFHAAEHAQRHAGQVATTARVVSSGASA
jgi:uncharacterized damage-inducible protein DinB